MSDDIATKMTSHTITEFWGGSDRGVCVQITAADIRIGPTVADQLQTEGFVQLTMEEAAALCNNLAAFVCSEAKRRQSLLREEIASARELDKTVFREVADLAPELFEVPILAVDLVAKFCPKVKGRGRMDSQRTHLPTEEQS